MIFNKKNIQITIQHDQEKRRERKYHRQKHVTMIAKHHLIYCSREEKGHYIEQIMKWNCVFENKLITNHCNSIFSSYNELKSAVALSQSLFL